MWRLDCDIWYHDYGAAVYLLDVALPHILLLSNDNRLDPLHCRDGAIWRFMIRAGKYKCPFSLVAPFWEWKSVIHGP